MCACTPAITSKACPNDRSADGAVVVLVSIINLRRTIAVHCPALPPLFAGAAHPGSPSQYQLVLNNACSTEHQTCGVIHSSQPMHPAACIGRIMSSCDHITRANSLRQSSELSRSLHRFILLLTIGQAGHRLGVMAVLRTYSDVAGSQPKLTVCCAFLMHFPVHVPPLRVPLANAQVH
jgi:hypothetical protein